MPIRIPKSSIHAAVLAAAAACMAIGSACASMPSAAPPTADEVPALHAALTRDPSHLGTRLRLAEAYRLAGEAAAARQLLEPIAATEPAASFQLGLILEDLGRVDEARQLYREYAERGSNAELRAQVRARLALLERRELEAAVRAALADEARLADRPPEPQTVGVFPFLAVTTDPELQPLGSALAELLTTDLSQTDRLRVLERAQVRALLSEMALGESGRVDPATAARSGRILGAGNIVQGRVEADAAGIALQAVVVLVPSPPAATFTPVREQDALARLFDMEKRLALALYERMGIQLTAAERERVTRHATQNVQALLAFGMGLDAADVGDHAEAARHFSRAVSLDPGFDLARSHWTTSDQLFRAANVGLADLAHLALVGAVPLAQLGADPFGPLESMILMPGGRDPFVEAMGTEGTGRRGTADIVIRRPGGTP
jgi:tetratricopeptide (TPR) repeat protein